MEGGDGGGGVVVVGVGWWRDGVVVGWVGEIGRSGNSVRKYHLSTFPQKAEDSVLFFRTALSEYFYFATC